MRTVYKFPILPGEFELEMSPSAIILDVQMQAGIPYLWALIPDTEALKVKRKFKTYGTGHEIMESLHRLDFIGTFLMSSLGLVWHLFEETKDS